MSIDHASAFVHPPRGTLNIHPPAMPGRRFGEEGGDGEVRVQVFRCSADEAPYLTGELFRLPIFGVNAEALPTLTVKGNGRTGCHSCKISVYEVSFFARGTLSEAADVQRG